MELWEAMEQRHSVRAYQDRPIARAVKEELEAWIAQCNREGGLHMQLILDEPRAFSGGWPGTANFPGAKLHCGGWPQRPRAGGGLRLLQGKRWC